MNRTQLVLLACLLVTPALLLQSCVPESTGLPETPPVSPVPTMTTAPTAPPAETPTITPTEFSTTSMISYTNPRSYEVEFVSTGKNGSFQISRLLLYLPLPIEWDAQQDMTIVELLPEGAVETVDPVYGNGLAFWDRKDILPAGQQTYFTIRFRFTAYETNAFILPETLQPYDTRSALYQLYTREEPFIELSEPVIQHMTDEAAGDETNPYLLTKLFYDYILDNFEYKLWREGLLGASELCMRGKGECGDYSALFIAMCRLKGIPARPVVGYWAESGLNQTHVWAEFYLEGVGWVPADLSIADLGGPKEREYYFGNLDNKRVILHKGFNLPLEEAPGGYVTPLLQLPAFWFWGSSGDAGSVLIEPTKWSVTGL